jgi:uncharacterized protein (TIGR03067 family)
MKPVLISLVVAVSLLGCKGSKDPARRDLEMLQGRWVIKEIDTPKRFPPDALIQVLGRVVIAGDKVQLKLALKDLDKGEDRKTADPFPLEALARLVQGDGNKIIGEGRVQLYPDKTPPAFDLTMTPRTGKGGNASKEKKLLGIYAIEGDLLRLLVDHEDKGRPEVFPENAGEGIITLEREKR